MNEINTKAYRERFDRILDYINTHLSENLSLDRLSKVANFSKYHFHRQFSEYFGISLFKYVQMMRLKRASYLLAFRSHYRIIDIAILAGFESGAGFSRAFKKIFGQTPKEFRNKPEWNSWRSNYQLLNHDIFHKMNPDRDTNQVEIVEFPETKIAVLEHRGSPNLIGNSIQKFIKWRKQNQLSPQTSQTYNIIYHDPATIDPEKYQIDICATVRLQILANKFGVINKVIPAGRCAKLPHIGTDENLSKSFNYLYGKWLPNSGEALRNFPCFIHRIDLFPDVAEHETTIDIYLPLQ